MKNIKSLLQLEDEIKKIIAQFLYEPLNKATITKLQWTIEKKLNSSFSFNYLSPEELIILQTRDRLMGYEVEGDAQTQFWINVKWEDNHYHVEVKV